MRQTGKYRKLTEADVLEIVRGYHLRGETQTGISRRFGVNVGYVSRIVRGLAWPEVYAQVEREEASQINGEAR